MHTQFNLLLTLDVLQSLKTMQPLCLSHFMHLTICNQQHLMQHLITRQIEENYQELQQEYTKQFYFHTRPRFAVERSLWALRNRADSKLLEGC